MYSLGKCHICSHEGKFCVSVYPAINLELLTVRNQDRPATLLSAGHQVNKSQLESFNCIFNRTANFATFFQHFPWKHYFSWILKFASVLFGERNDCAENLFTVEETCWNSQDRKKCQWKLSLLSFRSVPPFVQNHKNSSKILFWENKS